VAKGAADAVKPTNGTPPEPWAEPVPFSALDALPPFPSDLLPPWLREWVVAEAGATQTPSDLAGNLALAIAGAALARRVRVLVRPGWCEPANVFTVVSLPPGDRKSAVFAHATVPLLDHEAAERQRMGPIIAELASEHRVMEAKLKGLESKAAKEEAPAEVERLRQEARELAKELARHVVPAEPELFTDDVTPEKLVQMVVRQGGRMLLASAEGTTFEIAKGRYSETANFEVFLKGHAGDPLRTARVNRESDAIDHPALSCALAVQPDVISGLAGGTGMRGRGFLARWLYALPTSRVGSREIAPRAVPDAVVQQYRQAMLWLWQLTPSSVPGQEAGWQVPLSREADEVLRGLERWLEPQLQEGEPLSYLAGWGSKLAGACARLSLILHMAATLGKGEGWTDAISRETTEAAVALGQGYYLPHARAAFGLMGADERAEDAARVVGWLAGLNFETLKVWKGVQVVSRGEIHGKVFGGTRSVEEVTATCRLLCEHGYLRAAGAAWRRDVQLFEVNPHARETHAEG
jgi:hypothetical protein